MRIWTDLKHRNVLPCLVFAEYNNSLVLVSDWMENGNLIQFLSSNADAHRLEMVSKFLLLVRISVAIVQVGSVHQGFFGDPNLNQSEFG